MKFTTYLTAVVTVSALTVKVAAYGPLGHLLIAQVAQDYLSDESKKAIADILPLYTAGKIESIASWADTIKGRYYWSSRLHYYNPINFPPSDCTFEWHLGGSEVITAIYNYTTRLGDERLDKHQREEALKFLVHFIGDIHNPLHLSGREKGGNGASAIFEKKRTSLHRVWDSQILGKQSSQLPTSYLSYLLNHTRTTFLPEIDDWVKCPSSTSPYLSFITSLNAGITPPTCPEAWGADINTLNCEYVWLDYDPLQDLAEGEYWARITNNLIEERLLAKGGVRLAAVLNSVFGIQKEPEAGEIRVQFRNVSTGVRGWVEALKGLIVQN